MNFVNSSVILFPMMKSVTINDKIKKKQIYMNDCSMASLSYLHIATTMEIMIQYHNESGV